MASARKVRNTNKRCAKFNGYLMFQGKSVVSSMVLGAANAFELLAVPSLCH
jgi:hypothetical protein